MRCVLLNPPLMFGCGIFDVQKHVIANVLPALKQSIQFASNLVFRFISVLFNGNGGMSSKKRLTPVEE